MLEGESSNDLSDAGTAIVLIVDDDRVCREFCALALEAAGYRVVEAADARQGLRLLSALRPQVLVCDLRLPDPDAREALFSACRTGNAAGTGPALVVMSADVATAGGDAAPDPGICTWLRKPFSTRQLLAAVASARRTPGASGGACVRERDIPATENLNARFSAGLSHELKRLDRAVTRREWTAAIEILHRLRGGAAMSGHRHFSDRCRRLSALFAEPGPTTSGWSDRYLELLRLGEAIIDRWALRLE